MGIETIRKSGILLHPTSLPSLYGIGDLGKGAYAFIDYLVAAGQKLWQVLPLGPVGYGESPYSSYSSFAGNPLLIDLDSLIKKGFLEESDLLPIPSFSKYSVDFDLVRKWKVPLLLKASNLFEKKASASEKKAFHEFCEKQAFWLDDFALFMSVKNFYEKQTDSSDGEGKKSTVWNELWDQDIRRHEPKAIERWEKLLSKEVFEEKVVQYFFFSQWKNLKQYANQKGIQIIGDVPIFVAPDSSDVWAYRRFFLVDEDCAFKKVAGVPPDYFSPVGQRWGNPLYNWKAMEEDGFSWWISRFKALSSLVDIVRIDHFRGFEAYWEIPAEEKTAVKGRWVKAPGGRLFKALEKALGDLPVIAEDLGFITEPVHKLRKQFHFPGMKILQFAFEFQDGGRFNSRNGYLPHNFEENCVVYTGTHDNDTTLGWYFSLPNDLKNQICSYMGVNGHDFVRDCIRLALSSVARIALFPLQDLFCYGSESRMNTPSTVGGQNWAWRFSMEALRSDIADWMKYQCQMFNR